MKRLLLALLLACGSVNAATIYISACGTGADGACVAGSDSNDGLSTANPKLTVPTLVASNTYRFARGGAFARSSQISIHLTSSTKASPTIFEDYTPTWCTGGCTSQKPIIYTTANVNAIAFTDGGNADRDEGYVLRNIDIRGQGYDATPPGTGHGSGSSGILVFNDADYITVDGVSINGFEFGIYVSTANTVNPGANNSNEYFTLKNSSIVNNESQGFLGGGAWTLIENNTFDYNGFGTAVFDHNIYISTVSTNPKARNIIIRGNTLTNNTKVSGTCQSVSLVAHADAPDMVIENNTIIETATSATCYGIDINSSTGSAPPIDHSRLVIRGNKIVLDGAGSTGIGCSACPNAIIENNIIIRLGGTGAFKGIQVPSFTRSGSFGDAADGGARIRNNSIYIDAADASIEAIELDSTTTGETVASNVIEFTTNVDAGAKCFSFGTRAINTFTAFDYNACYRPTADATWSDQHSTLANAQAASFDTNSFKTDPGLTVPSASTYLLEASSGSAAIINAASATYKARLGYRGKPSNGARDIGACEYRTADACSAATASVPSSATGLR